MGYPLECAPNAGHPEAGLLLMVLTLPHTMKKHNLDSRQEKCQHSLGSQSPIESATVLKTKAFWAILHDLVY